MKTKRETKPRVGNAWRKGGPFCSTGKAKASFINYRQRGAAKQTSEPAREGNDGSRT